MKNIFAIVMLCAGVFFFNHSVIAQRITMTIAGCGISGYTGDGGPAKLAKIGSPQIVCSDAAGNVYFDDGGKVRRVSVKTGIITTIAGGGSSTADGIPAILASISPASLCCDPAGKLYIVSGYKIRVVDPATGIINTIAGNGSSGYSGDGGAATLAQFSSMNGIASDPSGNIYISDGSNQRIRMVTASTGIVNTVAGTGVSGHTGDGGPATAAQINNPRYIGCNSLGDIYFIDNSATYIRKITASTGIISTYAGGGGTITHCPATSTMLGGTSGMCVDAYDNVVFNETSCSCREISHITDSTEYIGGNYSMESYKDDTNSLYAWLDMNYGVASDGHNNVYIADDGNNRIRKLIQLTHTPTFAFGKGQSITPCPGYSYIFDSILAITDLDLGQTETWTVVTPPVHGTLTGFPAVALSKGTFKTTKPTGASYSASATYSSGADSFIISVSDGTLTDTLTVYVNVQMADPGTISGATSVCVGSSGLLTNSSSFPGIWSRSNSNATLYSTTGGINGVLAGTDTMTYTLTSTCPLTATVVITVNPLPATGTVTGPDTVCTGAEITLSDSVTGGTWSSLSPYYATVTPTSGIVYGVGYSYSSVTIKYTATNAWCSANTTKSIYVNSAAMPIAGSNIICVGTTTTLDDYIIGGVWSSANGNASVAPLSTSYYSYATVTGATVGVDTIYYMNTNSCGSATVTKIVSVDLPPSAGSISGASEVCVSGSTTFTSTVSGGRWSNINSNAYVGILSGVVNGYHVGPDSIKYTVSLSPACSSSVARAIYVVATPFAGTIAGESSLCSGSMIFLSDTTSGGTWWVSNSNANVSATGVVNGIAPGLDTVTYMFTSSCGIASTTSVITINPMPDAGCIFAGESSVCVGSTISMTESVSGGAWGAYNTDASVSGGVVTGLSTGVDTIFYLVSNSCGLAIATKLVTVNDCGTTGVSSTEAASEINIFPNPAESAVFIQTGSMKLYNKALIMNELGQTMMSVDLNSSETQINIESLTSGMYYILLKGESNIRVIKLMKF